ncbi:MAG: hypothetical protein BGO26_15105 [Actinobacteria bacterium 69-20]|nr:hypothetical protein [Actinomycetota bacterium]OJV29616.1 MAG: hypothetical protein BGO26_15105 [Actinobacteria bacterium 69-20]
MIQIDIDADLNWVDDDDRNIAKLPAGESGLYVGSVAVAGRPGLWSWVFIDEIDTAGGWIYFRQIDSREAAQTGELAVAARR